MTLLVCGFTTPNLKSEKQTYFFVLPALDTKTVEMDFAGVEADEEGAGLVAVVENVGLGGVGAGPLELELPFVVSVDNDLENGERTHWRHIVV